MYILGYHLYQVADAVIEAKDCTSLSLRTCMCVKPVKNELMAPSSPIFS